MQIAHKNGIALDQFWQSTPFHLKLCVQAGLEMKFDRHDEQAWFMWHGAMLASHKFKKFPELSVFLSKRDKSLNENKKQVDGINENAIMAWLTAAQMNNEQKKAKK